MEGGDIIACLTGGLLVSVEEEEVAQDESLALVQDLIAESGKDITFIRFKQEPEDSNKPWNGPDDPREVPDAIETMKGVFVSLSGVQDLGITALSTDLLRRVQMVCLVAPKVSPSFDIKTANEVIDDEVYRRVEFVEELKPGNTTLLYYVGISR